MKWFRRKKNKVEETVEENLTEIAEEAGEAAEETAEAAAAEAMGMISIEELGAAAERAAEEAAEAQTAAAELTEAAEAASAETTDDVLEAADAAAGAEAEEFFEKADEEVSGEIVEEPEALLKEAEEGFENAAESANDTFEETENEFAAEAEEELAEETEEELIEEADEDLPEFSEEGSEEAGEDESLEEPEKPEKKGFFRRLVEGLSKTRANIARSFSAVFSGSSIDDDFYEELEEIMITADMGVETTDRILDDLRDKVEEQRIKEPAQCRDILIETIKEQMEPKDGAFDFEDKKTVILVIGVNGVGKTTSIGKLAAMYKNRGKRVLLAAADTFRAAACEQLKEWANRAGVEIVSGQEGADPGAVVYDAIAAAKARNADILICDTAGRLHNKKNLMDELGKINRIIGREYPEAHLETFVVVDGTTGQNALIQARQFGEIADVTGIILTKLDGTAKGGIAVAIESQLDIPVKFIGVGEKIDDLQKFDADSFVSALFEA